MKTILCILLWLVFACVNLFAQPWSDVTLSQLVVATSCTPATGNVFNELCESGQGSWTELTAGIDFADSLPSTPCSGLGATGFGWDYTSGGTKMCAQYDLGSASSETCYIRFYFYINSIAAGSFDDHPMFAINEVANNAALACNVVLRASGGVYTLKASSVTSSSTQNVSSNAWYRVEIKLVPNNGAGASVFRIYDSSGSQIGSDSTFNTNNTNLRRYITFGMIPSAATCTQNISIDGIAISNTDWLGQ